MQTNLAYATLRWITRKPWVRGRERLVNALASAGVIRDKPFQTDFFGLTYTGRLGSYIDRCIFFFGAYELAHLRFLETCAETIRTVRRTGVTYWDIGANSGQHVLYVSRVADRVCAFEPFPVVLDQLRRNVAINRLDHVTIYEMALGDRDGMTTYHAPPQEWDNLGAGSIFHEFIPESRGTVKVILRTGDDVVRSDAAPAPDLLKIDVQGAERHVLAGLRETVGIQRPAIEFEMSAYTRESFGSEEALRSYLYPGARLFRLANTPGGFVLAPFDFATTSDVVVLPSEIADMLVEKPGA